MQSDGLPMKKAGESNDDRRAEQVSAYKSLEKLA
jgi:hypothetical protein